MAMDNDKIKAIVIKAKALKSGEQDAEELMSSILQDMKRSPVLAVGILQHLREAGHDLMVLPGEGADALRARFKPQMDKLGEQDMEMVRRISDKLFS